MHIGFETWLVRLLSAVILSGLIGIERQFHGRPAGLRTHILVCVGAALIIIGGLCLANGDNPYITDPGRIAAGIVTGIGFLGAGAIIKTGDLVRGLTTAACIWFVAGLGIIIGLGQLIPAVVSTGIALVVLIALDYCEDLIPLLYYRNVSVSGSGIEMSVLEKKCKEMFTSRSIKVLEVDTLSELSTKELTLTFYLRIRKQRSSSGLVNDLSLIDGITRVEWKSS